MGPCIVVLLATSLGATPSFSVFVTRRVGVEPASALEYADALSFAIERQARNAVGRRVAPRQVSNALAAAGLGDPISCGPAVRCAARLARDAHLDRVVALQVAVLGAEVILDATLVDAIGGLALASATATLPAKRRKTMLDALAADLNAKAPPWTSAAVATAPTVAENAPPPPDVPAVQPEVVPELSKPPLTAVVDVAPAQPASRVFPWITGAGAVVASGIASAFGILSLNEKNAWDAAHTKAMGDLPAMNLTRAEADRLAAAGNRDATAALLAGTVAVALVAATVVILLAEARE